METSSPPSGIWAKSVMPRQFGGSTTSMGNISVIRAEGLMASARQFQISRSIKDCVGMLENSVSRIFNFRIIIVELQRSDILFDC
jgi:hypothetical protein